MQHKRGGDADRNGDDAASQPVRIDAKGQKHHAGPESELADDQGHDLNALPVRAQAARRSGEA